MQAYIAKRILLFIPTIIFVTVLVFLVLRVVPGDPALMLVMGTGDTEAGESGFDEKELAEVRARLGTDRNLFIQYFSWLGNMVQLDFGTSFFYDTPVIEDVKSALPITLELTILAVLLATIVAVPLGVIAAIKQDSPVDYAGRIVTVLGIAIPNFGVAIVLIYLLMRVFNWFPPLGYANLWDDPGKNLQQIVFPAIALGFSNMAFIARVTRSAMLEVFREDYIRTARSKGLAERVVVFRHALKNALLPVVTVSGYEFGRLLAGTVIIETLFLVPGVGRLLINGIFQRDFIMVQGIVMTLVVIILVLNLFLDMAYAWLNPRIRYT